MTTVEAARSVVQAVGVDVLSKPKAVEADVQRKLAELHRAGQITLEQANEIEALVQSGELLQAVVGASLTPPAGASHDAARAGMRATGFASRPPATTPAPASDEVLPRNLKPFLRAPAVRLLGEFPEDPILKAQIKELVAEAPSRLSGSETLKLKSRVLVQMREQTRQAAGDHAKATSSRQALLDDAMAQMHGPPQFAQAAFLERLQGWLGQAPATTTEFTDDVSQPDGRPVTVAQADALVARLADDASVPYGYIHDGCYARAHIACDLFAKEGIGCGKIFATLDQVPPYMTAANQYMSSRWMWHVAAFVYVRDEATGQLEIRVIDPAFSRQALTAQEWLGKFRQGLAAHVDLTNKDQYVAHRRSGKTTDDFAQSLRSARDTLDSYKRTLERDYGAEKT